MPAARTNAAKILTTICMASAFVNIISAPRATTSSALIGDENLLLYPNVIIPATFYVQPAKGFPDKYRNGILDNYDDEMAKQIAQNEMMYNDNPTQYEMEEVQEQASPEEMDAVIAQMNGAIEPPMEQAPGVGVEGIDMPAQDGAYVGDMEAVSPEMGAMTANPNAMI